MALLSNAVCDNPKQLQMHFRIPESSFDACTPDAGMLCCMVAVELSKLKCQLQEMIQSARRQQANTEEGMSPDT